MRDQDAHDALQNGKIEVTAEAGCKTLRAAVESCIVNAAHTIATFEFKVGKK
jgi:hypothetical protein